MKRNLSKHLLSVGLLSAFFLLANPTSALSNTDLVVEGQVLGYELNTLKSFGTDGIVYEYPALIRITKVLEGEEKSQYIIVLLKFLDKKSAEEKLGLDKIITFRLERKINYTKRIKDLLHSGFTVENGDVVKTAQTFTFVNGVKKQSLPLKQNIQCYVDM